MEIALNEYKDCRLCGKDCQIDRFETKGYCKQSDKLMIAWAGLHFGEEPPLTREGGSGTIFFTGCTLGCPFCQNYQISQEGMGEFCAENLFYEICLHLKDAGAENINLVTPSHFIPTLALFLEDIKKRGINLPILWNSSAQESSLALNLVDPWVSVYLPDLKTLDTRVAKDIYHFEAYPEVAKKSILNMVKNKPLIFDQLGALKEGVLVRHLILPGEIEASREVLQWFSENLKGQALLSLMSQYTPVSTPRFAHVKPNRYLTEEEYNQILFYLDLYDLEDGFIQELVTGDDWLPDFNQDNPFSSDLSKAIWHWKSGFLEDMK